VSATVAPVNARDIANWDVEADVAIAGYGIAGAAAAIEAARAGGFVYLGGGTPIQKACGFDDSVDSTRTFSVRGDSGFGRPATSDTHG
jgi:3-oxo-5alpha-steroid 4-dehydrogenase